MAISLKHATLSVLTHPNDGELGSTEWNEEHNLTLATGKLVGRSTSGTGSAEEISVGSGLLLDSGTLASSMDVIYASDYGAVGDGTTDDTTALQNAINAVPARGCLVLDAGKTYSVTNLYFDNLNDTDNWGASIRAIGGRAVIKRRSGGDTDYMVACKRWVTALSDAVLERPFPASPWTFENIVFDANSIAKNALVIKNWRTRVFNCEFLNATECGILFTMRNQDASDGSTSYLSDCEFIGCSFYDNLVAGLKTQGRVGVAADGPTDGHILDCVFANDGTYGAHLVNAGGWTISHNRFYHAQTAGLYIEVMARGHIIQSNNFDADTPSAFAAIIGDVGYTGRGFLGPGNTFYRPVRVDFANDTTTENLRIFGNSFELDQSPINAYIVHNNNRSQKTITSANNVFKSTNPHQFGSGVTLGAYDVQGGRDGNGLLPYYTLTVDGSGNGSTVVIDDYDTGSGGTNRAGRVLIKAYNDDAYGDGVGFRYARGTSSAPTAVQSGDSLGFMYFQPYDGTSFLDRGYMAAVIDGAVSAGVAPTAIVLGTGSNALAVERFRIRSDGSAILSGTLDIGNADTTLSRVSAGVAAIEGKNIALNGTTETLTTGTIELGAASDTTISRSSAGIIAVEGVTVPLNSTTNTHTAQQIELGHASDTTLSRLLAGTLAVEGKPLPYVFAQSGTPASVGAVITEQALATITIPGGAMGPNGWVSVWTSWTVTNSANNKTCYVRVGGASGTSFLNTTLTTSVFLAREVHIINANSASSQKTTAPTGNQTGLGIGTTAPPTASVNTASNWDIVISGQKANSGETLTLEAYRVIIHYGA